MELSNCLSTLKRKYLVLSIITLLLCPTFYSSEVFSNPSQQLDELDQGGLGVSDSLNKPKVTIEQEQSNSNSIEIQKLELAQDGLVGSGSASVDSLEVEGTTVHTLNLDSDSVPLTIPVVVGENSMIKDSVTEEESLLKVEATQTHTPSSSEFYSTGLNTDSPQYYEQFSQGGHGHSYEFHSNHQHGGGHDHHSHDHSHGHYPDSHTDHSHVDESLLVGTSNNLGQGQQLEPTKEKEMHSHSDELNNSAMAQDDLTTNSDSLKGEESKSLQEEKESLSQEHVTSTFTFSSMFSSPQIDENIPTKNSVDEVEHVSHVNEEENTTKTYSDSIEFHSNISDLDQESSVTEDNLNKVDPEPEPHLISLDSSNSELVTDNSIVNATSSSDEQVTSSFPSDIYSGQVDQSLAPTDSVLETLLPGDETSFLHKESLESNLNHSELNHVHSINNEGEAEEETLENSPEINNSVLVQEDIVSNGSVGDSLEGEEEEEDEEENENESLSEEKPSSQEQIPLTNPSDLIDESLTTKSDSVIENIPLVIKEEETTHGHTHIHSDHSHSYNEDFIKHDTKIDDDQSLPVEQIHKENSPFITVVKHLSYSLLAFLPEHLQDTILDVNDALILTGIIGLVLISICVPYFFIETYMAVRPLKKKVVELNRNLWKMSTAYENQQDDYEAYKKKALAYDEDKDIIEKLETELHLVKQLDVKHQDTIKKLQKDLRSSSKLATDVEGLVDKTMIERNTAVEELEKMKGYLMNVQMKYKLANEAFDTTKIESMNSIMKIDELTHSNNLLDLKVKAYEKDITDYKIKLLSEGEKKKQYESDADKYLIERDLLKIELNDLKNILHQYEDTVNNLSQEISTKELELMTLKESLGEDSPLVEAAELSAKLNVSKENTNALQLRVDSLTLENGSLSQNLELKTILANELENQKDQAENKFLVLESYFKQKEEELRTMVEKYEAEKRTRGMDKDDLISTIEEKEDDIRELNRRINGLKQELEDTKQSHRNEIRTMEGKEHENWLLLCQSERKLQEARKNGDILRQKLTSLTREKEGDEGGSEELDGGMKMTFFPMIPNDLIPIPLPDDDGPTYIGLGRNFIPPPPLDDEEDDLDSLSRDREPMRPIPLGRLSPTFSDNDPLSPIGGPRGYDYSSGSSSPQRRPPSREMWMNGNDRGSNNNRRHRGPPKTSSPINHGVNV